MDFRSDADYFLQVIFDSGGAVAGILGSAAVAVEVYGLPVHGGSGEGEMELSGLPFQGSVLVGKKNMFSDSSSEVEDGLTEH